MDDPEPWQLLINNFISIDNILLSNIFIGFSIDAVISLIIILLLLLFSGLISGSEIAFFSLSPIQHDELIDGNQKSNIAALELLSKPKDLLAGILISNNFINISIILLSTYFTQITFDFSNNEILGLIFQIGIITSMLLLFGEILPKIYAKQKSLVFVNLMAQPLRIILKIFKPFISLLNKSTNYFDNKLEKHKPIVSMEDLSDAVDMASEMENMDVEEEEQKILKGIATFGDTEVKEIMKARVDVKAVELNTPFKKIIDEIKECGYSRIPVYKENLDKIQGILYVKDLLNYLNKDHYDWGKNLRPAFFIPESKKINDLLQEFRARKIHIAIVVDEYGGTSGIVTLEDVIEEIIGDISDEFDTDKENKLYSKVSSNVWIFEAKSSILDFCKIMEEDSEIFDDDKGESDSLAGLVLEVKGDFPELHEKIIINNYEFEILNLDKRKISKLKITKQ